jgi:hypothetical protein
MALVASLTPAGLIRGVAGPSAAAAAAPVLIVTGDIDGCHEGEDTAELVAKVPGPIATVGDNAYPAGSASDFARCYAPTWGALKDRTKPVPGNHDYDASKAEPYYEYFGAAAGDPTTGWYSYDVGAWHVVALNSNCSDVDCSKETEWLEADLAAHPSACTMAYWHHPRFTSGTSGGNDEVKRFWEVLYAHRASMVFGGHDHNYERFAPQNPSGRADPRGIRQFVVGTGGAALGSFARVAPNSEVRNNRVYGALELTLRPDGYDWRFLAANGDTFADSGSDTCRGSAPAPAPTSSTTVEPAAPSEEPDTAAPPSSPSEPQPSSPSTSPADPPVAGGRRRSSAPSPTTAPTPRSTFRAAPAGTAGGAAKPPATRPDVSDDDGATTAPPITPAPSSAAPAPTAPDGRAAAPSDVPAVPGADGSAGDPGGSATLALALSGLIDRSSAPADSGADRSAVALVALALLAADAAAIAALRRRGGRSGLSF